VGVNVLGEGGHLVVVGDIENAVFGHLRTERARVGDGFLQALGVTVGEVQLGAFGGQLQCGGAADAAGGPGQKTTLAGKAAPVRHGGEDTVGAACYLPPYSALSHSRSTMSTARAGSSPRPTNELSCVSVIVVVAANVRTSAGRSLEIGRASASCSTSVTIL